jgi:hypothetical protein
VCGVKRESELTLFWEKVLVLLGDSHPEIVIAVPVFP